MFSWLTHTTICHKSVSKSGGWRQSCRAHHAYDEEKNVVGDILAGKNYPKPMCIVNPHVREFLPKAKEAKTKLARKATERCELRDCTARSDGLTACACRCAAINVGEQT